MRRTRSYISISRLRVVSNLFSHFMEKVHRGKSIYQKKSSFMSMSHIDIIIFLLKLRNEKTIWSRQKNRKQTETKAF